MAGFTTATRWCLNSVLAGPMSWTSSYNQILCSFVILLAFYVFHQYTVTGLRKYYVWQWIIFLVGFGVLEENVVYPALAVAYCMLFARKFIVSALCMYSASILYAIVHNAYSKGAHQGIYAVEFGPQTITTLFKYWTYSVWPSKLDSFVVYDPHVATFMISAFSLIILGFVVLRNWKEPAALFGMAWFLIAIGPYLL